jgi:acetolactate synthase-1/2/3 large subunit
MQTHPPPAGGPAGRIISRTGAQIIVDALLAHGVETVFGYIGVAVIPLFDQLYESPIRTVVPCHEQGGAHMADAYARVSGTVGVIIATSGPGRHDQPE